MYMMDSPERFMNQKSLDELMIDLFKIALTENKVQAGKWRQIFNAKLLWG